MNVIMSRDVLSALRHRISELLPNVKSSKLAQAIAAGFGYKTSAAMQADFKTDDLTTLPVLPFDTDKFLTRLNELGEAVSENAGEILGSAFDPAPCIWHDRPIGPDFDIQSLYRKANSDWSNMQGPDAVLMLLSLFAHRTDGTITPIRFIEEASSRPGPTRPENRLLAIWRSMRDIDRPVADFLYEWMVSGLDEPFDEDAFEDPDYEPAGMERVLWGVPIFGLMFTRVVRFFDTIYAAWPEDAPLPAPHTPDEGVRPPRKIVLTAGMDIRDGEVGIHAFGALETGYRSIVGILSFAFWMAGVRQASIADKVKGILDAVDFNSSIVAAFPGTSDEVAENLRLLWSGMPPEVLKADFISIRDRALVDGVIADLEGAGQIVRPIKAPPGINTSRNRAVEFEQSLMTASTSHVDWLMVDFNFKEANPEHLSGLVEFASTFRAKLFLVTPGRNTDAYLEEAVKSARPDDRYNDPVFRDEGLIYKVGEGLEVQRTVKFGPETAAALRESEREFEAKFGRKPGPNDPVLWDPDADTPQPMTVEKIKSHMLATMHKSGFPPEFIYAYETTGFLVTPQNLARTTERQRMNQQQAVDRYFQLVAAGKDPYLGTSSAAK